MRTSERNLCDAFFSSKRKTKEVETHERLRKNHELCIYMHKYVYCIDRTSVSVSRGLQVEEDDLIQFNNGLKVSLANGNVVTGGGGASAAMSTSVSVAQLKKQLRSRLSLDDEDLEDEQEEEEEEDETGSARTADEQMDYLESLEPCPCYAKCCLDSLISLFCVTVLG